MAKKTISLTIAELGQSWAMLADLISLNDNPFKAHARRLAFKLQPEIKFLQSCDEKDIEELKDKTIELGEKIPPPSDFPDEYSDFIGKICTSVPVKESKIKSMLKK